MDHNDGVANTCSAARNSRISDKLSTSRGDVSTLKTSVMPSKHLPTTTQAPMRRLLVGAVISMMVHGKSSEYECQKYRKAKRESIPADFVKICEL
mmetsp:Transcript_105240/g.209203  ORF Transcript_105240/g.209203 Transcript_105240/m.209203 type:complete len:95 (+) Transcript_105240:138-422(+)